mgnify:CR=1 FL=1
MNRADTRKTRAGVSTAPYSDLYIYYLKGHLGSDLDLATEEFIGNWEEDEFSFLFFSRPALNKIESLVTVQPQLALIDEYRMSYADWLGEMPAPFQAGSFVVTPPWITDDPLVKASDENRLILLDPGLVFGTGTHPTTRDCLAAIERIFGMGCPLNLLDLGTGSGLLSLAAARLGAARILAVDINWLAAETAGKNVRRNRLENRILTVRGRAEDFIDLTTDLVIANIHYDVMKRLISAGGFLRNKWFILSGLLRSQAKDVELKLARMPVRIRQRWHHDSIWYTFMGEVLHQD